MFSYGGSLCKPEKLIKHEKNDSNIKKKIEANLYYSVL